MTQQISRCLRKGPWKTPLESRALHISILPSFIARLVCHGAPIMGQVAETTVLSSSPYILLHMILTAGKLRPSNGESIKPHPTSSLYLSSSLLFSNIWRPLTKASLFLFRLFLGGLTRSTYNGHAAKLWLQSGDPMLGRPRVRANDIDQRT